MIALISHTLQACVSSSLYTLQFYAEPISFSVTGISDVHAFTDSTGHACKQYFLTNSQAYTVTYQCAGAGAAVSTSVTPVKFGDNQIPLCFPAPSGTGMRVEIQPLSSISGSLPSFSASGSNLVSALPFTILPGVLCIIVSSATVTRLCTNGTAELAGTFTATSVEAVVSLTGADRAFAYYGTPAVTNATVPQYDQNKAFMFHQLKLTTGGSAVHVRDLTFVSGVGSSSFALLGGGIEAVFARFDGTVVIKLEAFAQYKKLDFVALKTSSQQPLVHGILVPYFAGGSYKLGLILADHSTATGKSLVYIVDQTNYPALAEIVNAVAVWGAAAITSEFMPYNMNCATYGIAITGTSLDAAMYCDPQDCASYIVQTTECVYDNGMSFINFSNMDAGGWLLGTSLC